MLLVISLMLRCELCADMVDALLAALACKRRLEEEESQNGKEYDDLQQYKPPELPAPSHTFKPLDVEIVYSNNRPSHLLLCFCSIKLYILAEKTKLPAKVSRGD